MASRLPSVLSPSISPKLSALRTRLGRKQSDHELRQILAELSALPANLVVRASREIAKKAGPGWWQPQMLPLRVVAVGPARLAWMRLKKALWLEWPSRSVPSEQELLKRNHDFAWLFLFHPSGYLREAALDRINSPPTSPFFFSALAWRLNDWVQPVRQAAERCAERVLHRTAADVAANAALYLLDRHLVWGRWSNEAKALDRIFEREDVMAALASQLTQHSTGPLANCLRHALRYPAMDRHLPHLASAAIQPSVRALAHRCLISGKATWTVGFEWAWVDKVYGVRRRVPKLESRDFQRTRPVSDLIGEAVRDKSAFVRMVAADALIAARSTLPDEETLIAHLERDPSSAVRARADFMRRHPSSGLSS
jgi:hypothetical protein